MDDFVLFDGDQVIFRPGFGQAVVSVKPGQVRGSGGIGLGGRKVCVEGDEKGVEVAGCAYITPRHSVPGSGTLRIAKLGPDQVAKHATDGGRALLLKGGSFVARFEVKVPAKQPSAGPVAPVADTSKEYAGAGTFATTNRQFKVS